MSWQCFIISMLIFMGQAKDKIPYSLSILRQSDENTQRLIAKNTLNYKAPCSFADEEQRSKLGDAMVNLRYSYGMDYAALHALNGEISNFLESSGQLCIGNLSLQCTPTGFCDCANGEIIGTPMWSVRENNECRLAVGSICNPAKDTQGNESGYMKCQRNSDCVFKDSTDPCKKAEFDEKLIHGFGGISSVEADKKGFYEYSLNMSYVGLCTCRGRKINIAAKSSSSVRSKFSYIISIMLSILNNF